MARSIGTGSVLPPGAPIPGPIAELLTPAPSNPNWLVPRIGPDGLTPMRAYAASTQTSSTQASSGPQIAIMVAGIGYDDTQSLAAANTLPPAVSLAITPYGQHIADAITAARAAGHEILLALPMQETDPVTENAGNEALVVAGPVTLNQPMLDWNLSHFQGYAGVTDAIGVSMGGGFMNDSASNSWLMQELADRGLFFVDGHEAAHEAGRNAGPLPYAWGRSADIVIDPVNAPQNEAAQLTSLVGIAKSQNAALGILLNPSPNAVQALAVWAEALGRQGITLVPVSALVLPPNAPAAVPTVSPTP
jgi:uncharacterized protein